MAEKIGIDFGTTNSLISVITKKEGVKSFTQSDRPHPSVVHYQGNKVICGKKAKERVDQYGTGIDGNTVRGPKKYIRSDAISVGGVVKDPKDVVTDLVNYLKEHASLEDDEGIADLQHAVVTIPVAMDGVGRRALREAFLNAGIHIEAFVHEPLAALYAYFRSQPDFENEISRTEGKLALVFDWGGGTLDLTLCQINNGAISQVINRGNNKVGGDYLDEAILQYVEEEHARKFNWNDKTVKSREPGMKAKLLQACEKAKIILSDRESTFIYVPDYYKASGDEAEIECEFSREQLNEIAARFVNTGIHEIESLLSAEQADVDPQTISLCLATGGMVNMPIIRQFLQEKFGVSRLHVSEIGDQIISHGAAWVAHDDVPITLAKPFEVVEARNSMITVLNVGTPLPKRGDVYKTQQAMYCVDPRDGKAVLSFKRPQMVGKDSSSDPRTAYGNMVVNVNKEFPPLRERIDVEYAVDENLIVQVKATALDQQQETQMEIYDIEFSLQVSGIAEEKKSLRSSLVKMNRGLGVVIRSNITNNEKRWDLVPGELLKQFNRDYPFLKQQLTDEQEYEQVLYQPCMNCGARWQKGCCEGL
jgi:molecular chaperone DnaK (HSP70)